MPGQPTFNVAAAYGGNSAPAAAPRSGAGSHTSFLVWTIVLGVILPVLILGGLKMGGFSFVFKGRG